MKAPNDAELLLGMQMEKNAIFPLREYRFAKPRRFRADIAILPEKVLVEIEGGIWTRGRHTRGKGYQDDMNKYNIAAILGWRVIRFSTDQVMRGEAILTILECIDASR